MKHIQIVLVAMGLTVTCNVAHAARYVLGAGAKTCGNWTQASPGLKHVQLSWVLGYLVGINYVAKVDILESPDAAAIKGWIDNYCRAHPLNTIARGSSELARELVLRATAHDNRK